MNPKLVRTLALLAGLIVVIGAFAAKSLTGGSGGAGGGETKTAAAAGEIGVTMAYSPEKDALLTKAFAQFNAKQVKIGGKRVVAIGQKVSSGTAYASLAAGKLKPTIWSPSSSLWGRLLTQTADVSWIPRTSPSFARTPLVIAIWEQQARALGWPKKQLGFADILAEARNPEGFTRLGHPEWGRFRLGHTNPDFSTSGLSAVAAEYYAATGKSEGLTLDDLEQPSVRAQIRAIEASIVHYGDTTLFFAEQLAKRGPAYASAVAMEETTLIDFNTRLRAKGGQKLVAIYPKEGTFFSDNPLITLAAPWVDADQAAGAAKLVAFLQTADLQREVGLAGFRPASTAVPMPETISARNGVDPAQPERLLSLPEPKVLARLKALWREDRKPADVAIVLDTSGSMQDEGKLDAAKLGLKRFIKAFAPQDRASLIVFNDRPSELTPLERLGPQNRGDLLSRVDGLFASGGTAVFDATEQGLALLRRDGDPDHIQAVVVLTDGQDTRSQLTAPKLLRLIDSRTGEQTSQRIFTIAYGSDANRDELGQISAASGGVAYAGDAETIDNVYISISSFF